MVRDPFQEQSVSGNRANVTDMCLASVEEIERAIDALPPEQGVVFWHWIDERYALNVEIAVGLCQHRPR